MRAFVAPGQARNAAKSHCQAARDRRACSLKHGRHSRAILARAQRRDQLIEDCVSLRPACLQGESARRRYPPHARALRVATRLTPLAKPWIDAKVTGRPASALLYLAMRMAGDDDCFGRFRCQHGLYCAAHQRMPAIISEQLAARESKRAPRPAASTMAATLMGSPSAPFRREGLSALRQHDLAHHRKGDFRRAQGADVEPIGARRRARAADVTPLAARRCARRPWLVMEPSAPT